MWIRSIRYSYALYTTPIGVALCMRPSVARPYMRTDGRRRLCVYVRVRRRPDAKLVRSNANYMVMENVIVKEFLKIGQYLTNSCVEYLEVTFRPTL